MASAIAASQFLGQTVVSRTSSRQTGARQSVQVNAIQFPNFGGRGKGQMSRKDKNTVKRGEQGQVKKAGKALPKDPKKMEDKPERARKMFNARNLRREGGAAGGQPWQKIDPKTPGYRGIPKTIDPLVFVGGLIATYVALQVGLTATG